MPYGDEKHRLIYKELVNILGSAYVSDDCAVMEAYNRESQAPSTQTRGRAEFTIMSETPDQTDTHNGKEVATLAGGCFWWLEAIFSEVAGVENVISEYSGGSIARPSYIEVCSGTTGHAEVGQLTFNPEIISFNQILKVFFSIHDPTTLNQQGADTGTQYHSAIFYHSAKQKTVAEQVIRGLDAARIWAEPIVTEVTSFTEFYPAEDYHQNYFRENPKQLYCRLVIAPKLTKFRKVFRKDSKDE